MVVTDAGALWLAAGWPQLEPVRAGYVFATVALPLDAQFGAGVSVWKFSSAPNLYWRWAAAAKPATLCTALSVH